MVTIKPRIGEMLTNTLVLSFERFVLENREY